MTTVNLNDKVTVRLTVWGLNKLKEKGREPKDDAGRFSCHLWELFSLFGEHTHIGLEICFEGNTLFLQDE